MQPPRIHIQSIDGTKLPLTWSWSCSISGTPKKGHSETDHWSIQQCLIHTRWWTALHLWTTNYGNTPSTNHQPQCMASPIPGWTTQTLQYSETRTTKLRHNNQIPHCMNSMMMSCRASRLDLSTLGPLLSLTVQVQPNRLSSPALLHVTWKLYCYYYKIDVLVSAL